MVRTVDFHYSFYDALVSINVPNDKARAVVDAMERDMATHLVTKFDVDVSADRLRWEITLLRQESKAEFVLLRRDVENALSSLRKDMTIWLGSAQILGIGLLLAALKLT
jgi:hypothetical protein